MRVERTVRLQRPKDLGRFTRKKLLPERKHPECCCPRAHVQQVRARPVHRAERMTERLHQHRPVFVASKAPATEPTGVRVKGHGPLAQLFEPVQRPLLPHTGHIRHRDDAAQAALLAAPST